MTKENRKEIIKVLNSFGLTKSKSKINLKEVTFRNYKKRTTIIKSGYDISKDSKNIYIIFENYVEGDFNIFKKNQNDLTEKITNTLKENNFNVEKLEGENIILING